MPDAHAIWLAQPCLGCGTFAWACTDCQKCATCHEGSGSPTSPSPLDAGPSGAEPALVAEPPKRKPEAAGMGTLG